MNIREEIAQTAAARHWERVGISRHYGVALILSSLHSQKSCGIGEFFDLLPLLPWCRSLGLDLIQLLPLNDTGEDPSPYNPLSAFALHPIYLSLHALPYLTPQREHHLSTLSRNSGTVDYASVLREKMHFLECYFSDTYEKYAESADYKKFIEEERSWLRSYGEFRALREQFPGVLWKEWPVEARAEAKRSLFYQFVQYLAFTQLSHLLEEARKAGVLLKGDVPFLLSRESAEVWSQRDLFFLDRAAGAPPDMYTDGQYWGFPVYNWEVLRKNNFSFWRERLRFASRFYDLYRLDHVAGFYHIWTIPVGAPAKSGFYVPAQLEEALRQGEEILRLFLEASPLLPVGEDLGAVPPQIRESLRRLGIPGTRVMRWERDWDHGAAFIPFDHYTPLSMTTLSTHDSETVTLWWANPEARECANFHKWEYNPLLSDVQRRALLKESFGTSSLLHINLLQEYLACFPELVAENPVRERINIPGTVVPTNWAYRLRPSVEELVAHVPLQQLFRELITRAF